MINLKKINLLLFILCFLFFSEKALGTFLLEKKENNNKLLNLITYNSINNDLEFSEKQLKQHSKFSIQEKIKINQLIDIFISTENLAENKSENYQNIDIQSDFQSLTDNKLIAKGNVIARSKDIVLYADEFEYEKIKEKIFVRGNITIIRNNQYLKAKELSYNFLKKEGYIKNIYGIIDFSNFLNDLVIKEDIKDIEDITEADKFRIRNVTLGDTSKLEFSSKENKPKFDNFKIEKWRFKANRIDIKQGGWESKKLTLTNDPFNKPQLKIETINFKAKQVKNYIMYSSKWSYLVLESSIKIPIGPRRIKGDGAENNQKWGLLYDKNKKDGFYIINNLETINLDKKNNFTLDLKPQFLLQRSINNSLSTLPKVNDPLLSSNSKQEAKFLDYFAIDKDFNAKLNKWNLNINSKLNSLNLKRSKHSLQLKSALNRNIFNSQKNNISSQLDFEIFGNLKEKVWNGSIGEKDIISAYGLRLKNNKNWNDKGVNKSLSSALSYGYYEAEASLGENNLINKNRLDLNIRRSNSYNIWKPISEKYIDNSYKYSPSVINNGIFLELSSELDLLNYSDGSYQNTISFKAAPTFIYGKLRDNYFDFFYLTIAPKVRFKEGGSPFDFDEAVDNKVIEINSKMQLFGPLLVGYQGEYNIDPDSNSNGNFINNQFSLTISRRAYDVELYYKTDEKVGGLKFNIHNFSFDGSSDKF